MALDGKLESLMETELKEIGKQLKEIAETRTDLDGTVIERFLVNTLPKEIEKGSARNDLNVSFSLVESHYNLSNDLKNRIERITKIIRLVDSENVINYYFNKAIKEGYYVNEDNKLIRINLGETPLKYAKEVAQESGSKFNQLEAEKIIEQNKRKILDSADYEIEKDLSDLSKRVEEHLEKIKDNFSYFDKKYTKYVGLVEELSSRNIAVETLHEKLENYMNKFNVYKKDLFTILNQSDNNTTSKKTWLQKRFNC